LKLVPHRYDSSTGNRRHLPINLKTVNKSPILSFAGTPFFDAIRHKIDCNTVIQLFTFFATV
jgi:hypothetical protein